MNDDRTRDLRPGRGIDGDSEATRPSPPSEAEYMALLEGDQSFAHRYRDLTLLGRGGMGEVMLCADRRTEREVALKRIDRTRRARPQRERFLREARIQARLDHPTIVPVYDIGIDSEGLEYFTMKRAQGLTLEEILDGLARGDAGFAVRYTPQVRIGIFRQVCQGIEYAHSRGIIHRDLKPANVMVGEHGEVYVLDWGLAKIARARLDAEVARNTSFQTARGAVFGTPGYLAPEQALDAEAVDERADVYSLGAILFELLALEPLHRGADTEALLSSTQLGLADARVSARRPELAVPPELERACVLATRAVPEERMATVSQLHAVVAGYLDGDRDLALRRSLSQRHADLAASAHAELLAKGDADGALRERALREAGHALALDPQSGAAARVITAMTMLVPEHVPAEVRLELRRQERAADDHARRRSVLAYMAYLPLALAFLPFVHVRSWLPVVATFAPLGVAIASSALRGRFPRLVAPPLATLALVLTSIAASSTLLGPYVIMPMFAAAYAPLAMASAAATWRRPRAFVLLTALALLVPMALEALGLLPVGFEVTRGRVLIEHRITDASVGVIRVGLVLATFASVFVPMAYAYQIARQLREARVRQALQAWHLRKMAPAPQAS